jgi:hypothetical protein
LKENSSKKEYPLVFFHFHGLQFFENGTIYPKGRYSVSPSANELIFLPYIQKLEAAKKRILEIDDTFDPHGSNTVISYNFINQVKGQLHHVKRAIQAKLPLPV